MSDKAVEFQKLLQAMVETIRDDGELIDKVDDVAESTWTVGDMRNTRTYQEAGMLTHDAGLVFRMCDGTEFRVTINMHRG